MWCPKEAVATVEGILMGHFPIYSRKSEYHKADANDMPCY